MAARCLRNRDCNYETFTRALLLAQRTYLGDLVRRGIKTASVCLRNARIHTLARRVRRHGRQANIAFSTRPGAAGAVDATYALAVGVECPAAGRSHSWWRPTRILIQIAPRAALPVETREACL